MSVDAAIQQMVQQTVSAMLPQIVQAVQGQIGSANVGLVGNAAQNNAGLTAGASLGQVPREVTPEMVQTLVASLVNDEAKKQRLIQEMQAMGISDLPAVTPAQLPELYQRFCAVRDEGAGVQQQAGLGAGFTGLGMGGGAAAAGGTTII
jgi:hypothetical protein